jgi:tRNA modification GTPase
MNKDTIAAIATAKGFGAIGIVKISGRMAFDIVRRIFQRPSDRPVPPRLANRIVYGRIIDPTTAEPIDEVLVSFMREPATYTGEDVVEINAHGGPVVQETILSLVLREGARIARPGEFTLRAFLNGRIDLTQAEAIADIINARTQKALKLAARHLDGRIHHQIDVIRSYLEALQMRLEAAIDFPDEVEIELGEFIDIESVVQSALLPIRTLITGYEHSRIIKEGLRIGIVGPPNVGKSSLMNRLLQKDRVIVTDIPGTTRDVIEDDIQIQGIPVALIDTAGLREAIDPIERIGIENTRRVIRDADLVLCLFDGTNPDFSMTAVLLPQIENPNRLSVINKIDLIGPQGVRSLPMEDLPKPVLTVSAKTGEGIDGLETAILHALNMDNVGDVERDSIATLRQQQELAASEHAVSAFIDGLRSKQPPEIISIDLQEAIDRLNAVIGNCDSGDVLDRIFEQFCIGK